ncbi:MAG: PAS domain S-box protein [Proteobacteria bacterium]|nr:PAS domain S-box protein [Pseudomonadota bacterium]
MRPWIKGVWRVFFFALVVIVTPAVAAAARLDTLLVFSQNRLLPANQEVYAGLVRPGDLLPSSDVQIYIEYLDHPQFSGDPYDESTAKYLADKYAARPPKLILAGGYIALKFLLKYRDSMFPGVPILHIGVDRSILNSMPALPSDVTGIPVEYDIGGTIDLAMALQPDAKRLVVVSGASPWAEQRRADTEHALARRKVPFPVEYWRGLETSALLAKLAALPKDSIVFTPGYYRDGGGRVTTPLESVRLMASRSSAPIYSIFSTHIGTGVLGGRMSTFTDIGKSARAAIDDMLDGDPAVALQPAPAMVQLDWRQVLKWGIPESRIPPNAVLHHRTPTFWELHRTQAISGAAIILAQALMIGALLLERRRRERIATALADSRRRVGVIAQTARVSIFVWDMKAQVPAPGARIQPISAADNVESFSQVVADIHPSDRERVSLAARHAIESGEELNVEYRKLPADGGHERWMAARGHAWPKGTLRISGVCMDISERKHAELQAVQDRAALAHMARVSTMGQLSVAIAHQLNQPLAAVLGNAEVARRMVARQGPEQGELGEILDDIISDNMRAGDIIRNLTTLYRRGPTKQASFDMNDLATETVELMRDDLINRKVDAHLDLAADLPLVEGTRIQIQQVLLNLLQNAMDAMEDTRAPHRDLLVRSVLDNGRPGLCVIDRGGGIAASAMERIFDPFWTTKPQGVGVGLAMGRAIIEAHGGVLSARNNPGGGAEFCFKLPASSLS